ncbi:MAG: rhodanese-like domain-containing protein, partial [Atribacterota bacterium]|nr:rhodanese-like domain-containing protein [Atribacterota bacterium]
IDNLCVAANVLRNKLEGKMVGISPHEVERKRKRNEEFVLLDVRTPKEYQSMRIPGSTLIPLGTLPQRLHELPRDKEIITFCAVSLRGYEASLILRHNGFTNVKVMDGGISCWPYELEK